MSNLWLQAIMVALHALDDELNQLVHLNYMLQLWHKTPLYVQMITILIIFMLLLFQ